MKTSIRRCPALFRRRTLGLTIVEVLVAGVISALVGTGMVVLTVMAVKIHRTSYYQQFSLLEARKAIESINDEVRLATAPLRVIDDSWNGAIQGNGVLFGHVGEPSNQRLLRLESVDEDMMTPQDNRLIYDPNTSVTGDEIEVARWLTPIEADGAFTYDGATTPLVVWMRAGDPVGDAEGTVDHITGPGTQGVEINITVAPRN